MIVPWFDWIGLVKQNKADHSMSEQCFDLSGQPEPAKSDMAFGQGKVCDIQKLDRAI